MQKIKPGIYSVGANDPDRKLFDDLIPLPDGTSYNSYLITGKEKTALIDTVEVDKPEILLRNLAALEIKKIDYIISNHSEQDHSGCIPHVLEKFPDAKVLCSDKAKEMLLSHINLPEEKIQIVKNGETLSLGDKTLEFIYTPWVHWPETMSTYLKEDLILFSCDLFGSHLACDDLLSCDKNKIYRSAKRYFAQIMMPYRKMVTKNISILKKYSLDMIAPSHGPIHTKPDEVIRWNEEWSADDVKNLAIIAYVSMHGSTRDLANYLADSLKKKGVDAHLYNLSYADIGDIAIDLVDASTLIIGTPCLTAGIHPSAANAAYLINSLKPKLKYISIIGSYGWSGGIVNEIMPILKNTVAELLKPVIIKGKPIGRDFIELDKLSDTIKEKNIPLKS